MKMVKGTLYLLGPFLVFAALLLCWHLVVLYEFVSPVYLSPPGKAFAYTYQHFFDRDGVASNLWATTLRMFYGWLLASMIGVVLGAIVGISEAARVYLKPTLEFLRPLPASAIVPLAIGFFGLTETMVLFVIAYGSFWPIFLAAIHGVVSVEPRLYEVARALRMNRFDTIWKIALPNAVPDILAGMRIGLAVALILTVVGEFMAGQQGLGMDILRSSRQFQTPQMFSGVIMLGLLGYACSLGIHAVEKRLLRWRAPS